MLKIRIMCLAIVMLLAVTYNMSIASEEPPSIYGVTIHLKNNEKLEGYIETYSNLSVCNQKKNNHTTRASLLERACGLQSERTDDATIKFINKITEIKYNNAWSPVVARSSVREIKVNNIKSIEGVCKNWDGYSGIKIITDYMAEYISNHTLIAVYIYEKDDGVAYCHTTYLSYNPKYTREMLIKNRKIIDKMSDDTLDKEKLIRFAECWS